MSRILTMGEVEEAIEHLDTRLVELTDEYVTVCDAAAEAESDYRLKFYRAYLVIKAEGLKQDDGTRKRATDEEAKAWATIDAEDEFRLRNITAASQESMKQALYTHRERLGALRTIAANARGNAS